MIKTVAQHCASLVTAIANCVAAGNEAWRLTHTERLVTLCREHMPHGSGIDAGTYIELPVSSARKLVFRTSYHHMNEHGSYDGWTEHDVTVRPAFEGYDITISGPDRNGIKEYLHEVFVDALSRRIDNA